MMAELTEIITMRFRRKSGIIYCFTRNECEEVAVELQKCGITAIAYHAGMTDDRRSESQRNWINGTCQVLLLCF